MRIVLLGSGNVATHLGLALNKARHSIIQVYSRQLANANTLGTLIGSDGINTLSLIDKTADLYLISVKDDVLKQVVDLMPEVQGTVCHTAGSINADVLSKFSHFGVFYPFQTFTKEQAVDFTSIPILLEGNSDTLTQELRQLANTISNNVQVVNSKQRGQLHLAAVFACNFVNYMYRMSHDLLEESGLSFDLLKPLILETANKVMELAPDQTQTGPASRNDLAVIDKHSELLKSKASHSSVYSLLTELILKSNR